ncbi:hypothetical protein XBO1_1900047 [Xenorhabdus bovienii str. oregonense]|uniref:Bacteriophage P22 tailspike N-terminal domain-containing protein n=1 Tax=Xenorhabdus bovienii str. oregonense TaxID=1398202 RepID=A0A077P310_XENBV|nr:phage tailspike protein [Xenorhabdus bovienii]CDH05430.1 hypothetical protein XBO1_1900047 [Xenorhabdus bovienii str. oregonense]
MSEITPNVVVSMPSQLFTMARSFKACSNGRIYIGKIDTDPTIPENQIQVYLERENGDLVPAPQPIIINAAGYPVYAGQIAKFVTVEGHSMAVYDSYGAQQFYFPNVLKYDPDRLEQRLKSASDGNGDALIAVKQPYPNAVARTQHDKNAEIISPLDFGAVGDGISDDTDALITALNSIKDNDVLDLIGKKYAVYNSVNGVSQGDAAPLDSVLRLYNCKNITIRNGYIFVYNPRESIDALRYPTTLTIDGCENITLRDVRIDSCGEGYGNTDASTDLNFEKRRTFSAQNGGHALLITRSCNISVFNSHFERAGSVGVVYSMSSDRVFLYNCYANARSLGYAAYAMDSWAGGVATSGFGKHETTLYNCSSDAGDSPYGSKGCVVAEDEDVTVRIHGGTYKDAYANGADTFLGAAFTANSCSVYVTGAQVDNCASIALNHHSANNQSFIECSGVIAKNLRTSMHIISRLSYGISIAKYISCIAEIIYDEKNSDPIELSIPTVIANCGVSKICEINIINCITKGADAFSINSMACYGGIFISGGEHYLKNNIFISNGWGGSTANSGNGYILNGTNFHILSTDNETPISSISNYDESGVLTYQYVIFDKSTLISSAKNRNLISIDVSNVALREKLILSQDLINIRQDLPPGEVSQTSIVVKSLDGISGSNVKVKISLPSGKRPTENSILIDDELNVRKIIGVYDFSVNENEVVYGVFINGTSYKLTEGVNYLLTLMK